MKEAANTIEPAAKPTGIAPALIAGFQQHIEIPGIAPIRVAQFKGNFDGRAFDVDYMVDVSGIAKVVAEGLKLGAEIAPQIEAVVNGIAKEMIRRHDEQR